MIEVDYDKPIVIAFLHYWHMLENYIMSITNEQWAFFLGWLAFWIISQSLYRIEGHLRYLARMEERKQQQ